MKGNSQSGVPAQLWSVIRQDQAGRDLALVSIVDPQHPVLRVSTVSRLESSASPIGPAPSGARRAPHLLPYLPSHPMYLRGIGLS